MNILQVFHQFPPERIGGTDPGTLALARASCNGAILWPRSTARQLLILAFLFAALGPIPASSMAHTGAVEGPAVADLAATPAWLEPRGISILELVGQVPDRYLQGAILSHDDGVGIIVYESGSRVGNLVEVTTSIYPRVSSPAWTPYLTSFGCLGEEPHLDLMGSAVPASVLRVYADNGTEVTAQISFMLVAQMAKHQPSGGSGQWLRYPRYSYGSSGTYPLPMQPDGLHIPANSGCRILLPNADYEHLTGVFTLKIDSTPTVSVTGVQQAPFRSYIGDGNVGIFEPLMAQLRDTYGARADRIPLNVPAGTSHFLLRFPPMPADPYTDRDVGTPYPNADRPVSGTYRLWRPVHDLSSDLTISAAFPISEAWRDADQAPGTVFLPLMTNPNELAAPEYIIPAGVAYQSCFTTGTCSSTILEEIYTTSMTLEIIYLSVTKPALGGEWIPLEMAGPLWAPSTSDIGSTDPTLKQPAQEVGPFFAPSDAPVYDYRIYLPFVATDVEEIPTGCPCGWFDSLGRMLGFSP